MNKKSILTVIFVVSLVISNVVTNRIIDFGVLTVAGGLISYAFTFLATDVIGELYGKQEAKNVVKLGLMGQVFASLLILATGLFPALSADHDFAFDTLLGANWMFSIASLSAYYLSQLVDVQIFHALKDRCNGKHKWLRNNASTISAQLVDTAVFVFIGFGVGMGLSWPALVSLMAGQYLVKVVAALLDTPLFYLLTRNKKRDI